MRTGARSEAEDSRRHGWAQSALFHHTRMIVPQVACEHAGGAAAGQHKFQLAISDDGPASTAD